MNNKYYRIFADPDSHPRKFIPIYGLFYQDSNGDIFGYVENSFSMSWSKEFVRGWDLKAALYYYNKYTKKKSKNTKIPGDVKYFIYRLTRRPKVATIVPLFAQRIANIKDRQISYYFRNIPFQSFPIQKQPNGEG